MASRGRQPHQQVLEGFAGVWCADGDNPDHVSAWARAARQADRKYPYFGRIWNWGSSICAFWPGKDADRYTGQAPPRHAACGVDVIPFAGPAAATERAVPRGDMMPPTLTRPQRVADSSHER